MIKNFDQYSDIDRSNFVRYNPVFQKMVFGQADLLPFWVADSDFSVMPELTRDLSKRAELALFPYETKSPQLKESISAWYQKQYNISIKAKRLLFTPSVNTSIAVIIELFTNHGEGVIIQPPVYQAFAGTISGLNRKVIDNPLQYSNGRYEIDFDDLDKKTRLDEAKIFLLCHPHNPIGRVWNRDELRQMAEICYRNNVLLVTDEIHGDITYAPNEYIGMSDIAQEFSDQVIMISSAGKTFGIPGILDSFIFTANTDYYKALRNRIEVLHIGKSNAFANVAWESIYLHGEAWLAQFKEYLSENINAIHDFLEVNIPEISFTKPEGTYQIWLNFEKLQMENEALTKFIVEKARIGMNPGHTYGAGGDGFMRMNIASPRDMLLKGMSQLAEAVANR